MVEETNWDVAGSRRAAVVVVVAAVNRVVVGTRPFGAVDPSRHIVESWR